MKKKNSIFIIIIILLAFVLLTGCKKTESKPEVGYTAPDFNVELLNGKTVKLSDYQGKVVLLNFWATWCGPCVSEMPDIQKLSDDYSEDLVVLAVNCNEKKTKVENFANENGYTFNVGFDENGDIQKLYPTNGIPYTLIIDAEGIISKIQLGTVPGEHMYSVYEEYIKSAMAE